MARSPEGRRRVVTLAYWQTLDRPADGSGRAHWAGRLAAGLGADELWATLLASPEAASHGLDDPAALTERLYRIHFDRAPDASGRAYWVDRLEADPSAAGRRSTALAFIRTAGVTATTLELRPVDVCGRGVRTPPGVAAELERRWAASGRDPVRLAASLVALVCPRLPLLSRG